jgi:hypothetical protein
MTAFTALTGAHGAALGLGPATAWGQWLDPMFVELLTTDGRDVKVFTSVSFRDHDGTVYTIPDGFVSDGASIPKQAWSIVGGPLSGQYRRAAVLHDYLLRRAVVDPDTAHAVFQRAMLADGCDPEQADLFYHAVTAKTWWDRMGALRGFLSSAWRVVRRVIPRL